MLFLQKKKLLSNPFKISQKKNTISICIKVQRDRIQTVEPRLKFDVSTNVLQSFSGENLELILYSRIRASTGLLSNCTADCPWGLNLTSPRKDLCRKSIVSLEICYKNKKKKIKHTFKSFILLFPQLTIIIQNRVLESIVLPVLLFF